MSNSDWLREGLKAVGGWDLKRKRGKCKVGLAWPSGKRRRCSVSYPTLPGLLGPILYSLIILQTILCLVLFLSGFCCCFFSPSRACWIVLGFSFLMYSTWSFVALGFWRRLSGPGVCLRVLISAYIPRSEEPGYQHFLKWISWNQ